ncbi:MAG: guanylate kinase [Bdellovibrionales bacterium]|nr:guanylate kinase [Bdellovibrionales bacterium]
MSKQSSKKLESRSKISNNSLIIVVSAPSGAGKTTIVGELVKKKKTLRKVITHTTRSPRPKEKPGKDYFFVTHTEFSEMILHKEFVEWAVVYNQKYGTSKLQIESILDKNQDVVLVIEEQGAREIKKTFPNRSVFVLLLPPSMKELEKRIKLRQGMNPEDLENRLKLARQEIQSMNWYDYVLVNRDIKKTVDRFCQIIDCEHLKLNRSKALIEGLMQD